jgi:O-succinylbenzoate synthase
MDIETIVLHHVRMPLQSHFETSFGRITNRECIIIEIYSEGLIGYGECVADRDPGYSYETVGTSWVISKEFIIPKLLGMDLNDVDHLHEYLANIKGHNMAKAGFEMAIWDLIGKRQHLSLSNLLGGVRNRVQVGVSVGIQDTTEDLLDLVSNYIKLGYQRIKLKIKPNCDVLNVSAVRDAFPEIPLQVDANSAYTLDNADLLYPLDKFGLQLIEQPLADDDIWDHHLLQKKIETPLCLDESITHPRHARQALDMAACKIINIKPGRVGGLRNAVEIHDICQLVEVPVWCGGMLETGIGRAGNLALASLPNFRLPGDISATDRYYAEDITNETFTLNSDSSIDVPNAPGLGVTINRSRLNKYCLVKEKF